MLKTYIEAHPWKIIERGWNAANHPKSESLFSIGNGRMGQRANFEETYTGNSLQGSYIAGVYYPDKLGLVGGKMVIPSISLRF